MHKTWVEINKKALQNNIGQFRRLIGAKSKLMAVVKANAYGHGLVEVAKIAVKKGADWLGVDSVDEAIKIRKAGTKAPILIMGYTLFLRLKDVVKYDFRQVIYNKETIEKLKRGRVHLKVETGTSRQGLEKEGLLELAKFIKKFPQIEIEGIYTHYANIEDTTDHSYAQEQLKRFKEAVNLLEKNGIRVPIKHTACSAAIILFPETYFDMVRLGISMYGLWPSRETFVSAQEKKRKIKLEPILTWKTKIAQIKNIKAGTPISYGLTEKISQDSKIAILPVGYFDGYDRKLSGVGNVLIGGKRCKILGRVCMNMIMVDVSHIPDIKLEDEVVLLGKQGKEQITAEELAQKIGTINYEVVTRINPLIPRIVA
jgi:alanine racemase